MKYVLDTNVVSRVLDGDDRVLGPLAQVEPQDVGIPLLVLAELLFGAEKSARREENRKRVEAITQRFPVLSMRDAGCGMWDAGPRRASRRS